MVPSGSFCTLLTTVLVTISATDSAKILGVFFVPSVSHQIVYQPIWKELSLRGHEVTVLTPNPLKNPKLTNLTEIDLSSAYDIMQKQSIEKEMSKDKYLIESILFLYRLMESEIINELENKHVQRLLNDDTAQYDLILVEALHPFMFGFAHKFKAPLIGISSLGGMLNSHDAVGNPTHPIISPDILMPFSEKLSFYEKIQSTLYNIWYRILYYHYLLPQYDTIARKYFGADMPYLGDLEKNMSLLMLNVNPILHPIRPNVPTIIELGQMHIKPKKPLPKDLQDFLDTSTEGVIYFSLGSNVKSANLTENVRNIFINALSELPYKVLWKWETDHLPNQPKNVFTRKWLPQQDVLRHPNVKAFITQGGLQSMEEAIVNGVPLIGIPFFADQPLNVEKMVELGIGEGLQTATMRKDELRDTIIEVATNDKYRNNVKRIGNLLNDQPMTGLERAIWWIEYVIRHNGASHLRSGAINMSFIEYYLVDVYLFIIAVTVLVIYIIYLFVYFILKSIHGKEKLKTL